MSNARRGAAAALIAALVILLSTPLLLRAGNGGVMLPGTQPADGSGDPAFPPFLNDALPGPPIPGTFDRPGVCDGCHENYRAPGETIFEPWDAWSGSMMANAARDPLFWAALDVANQDDAALGGVGVGDLCLRCHVPKAWYEGRSKCDTPWGESFDGSCLTGTPDVIDNDFEGILCSTCHRSYDASNPPPGQFADAAAPYAGNAQLYFSTANREMLGPFSDAEPLAHTARQSLFHLQSAFCGQCHDVTNPARNRRDPATGADLGYRMPIERTWSEYAQSRIGDQSAPEHRTCQGCHMPEPDLDGDGRPDDARACWQGEPRGRATVKQGPLRTHVFAGANTFMLGVLKGEYGVPLVREDRFDATIEATRKLLQESSVELALTAPLSATAGDVVPLSARVTNLAGHKFPTGYPEGRRAWVAVTVAEDRNGDGAISPGEAVFESAAYDPATGTLTQDAQAKIYEAKVGVWDFNGTGQCDLVDDASGRKMFHFVLNDCWVEDNRIPPLGFVPSAETQPVGYAYPGNPALPGTLANWDDTAFAVPVPVTAAFDLIVDVRVRYQSSSRDYIEFLRDENRSTCDPFDDLCDPTQPDDRANRGEKMHALWERYGRSLPVDLATARATISLTPAPPSACCVLGACTDLDAASCVALEGDFLVGAACAGSPCPPAPPPPGEASDVLDGAAPLRVAKAATAGRLDVTYRPACDASDHALVAGPLSGVASHASSVFQCGLGTSGATTFDAGSGSWWMVIVGRTAAAEGSYGRDSSGTERPQLVGTRPCDRPQDLSATCR